MRSCRVRCVTSAFCLFQASTTRGLGFWLGGHLEHQTSQERTRPFGTSEPLRHGAFAFKQRVSSQPFSSFFCKAAGPLKEAVSVPGRKGVTGATMSQVHQCTLCCLGTFLCPCSQICVAGCSLPGLCLHRIPKHQEGQLSPWHLTAADSGGSTSLLPGDFSCSAQTPSTPWSGVGGGCADTP